ncbi:MAG: GDSL-type esterase/lipase family protein [Candidatus Omnitrophota bacterium]|nr:GDSL-type esterase/lipase family protein [Candidatus Omnitrophota bacterium]
MTIKKQKALLILIGLVIVLLFMESSLRLAGFICTVYRTKNRQITVASGKQIIKILCLGDSFTFGLGGGYGNDYPSQLEKMLNENVRDKKFIVYNRGIPGNNSSMVLKNLVRNINTYKPDIALLLIGSNDPTTLEDSDYYLFKSPGIGKIAACFLRLDISLSKLKTYKLVKILILNLRNKINPEADFGKFDSQERTDYPKNKTERGFYKNPSSEKNEIFLKEARDFSFEGRFADAGQGLMKIPGRVEPKDRKEYLFLSSMYYEQEKYDLAIGILKGYLQDNPQDAKIILELGKNYYFQGQISPELRKENFQQAIELFNRSLSCVDPDDLTLKVENYNYLAMVYFTLGNNTLATKMMEQSLSIQPNSRFARQFKRVIWESSQTEAEKEVFKKVLFYSLGKIINICRIYNIKIILLNYPHESKGSVREEIANAYQVPFIDIGSKFGQARSNQEKDLLSSDRKHPNAQGYRLMAGIVFEALHSGRMGTF